MAPTTPRKSVPKDRFPSLFATLRTQTYYDPSSTRGPGSHTIRTIAWNPTGHLIATGSADRTLRIWNPEKPQVKNSTELRGHTGAIERVAWNPVKEAELASVSSDGTCRFWDVRSKTCIASIPLGGEGLTIGWASDGSLALVGRKDDTLIPIYLSPDCSPTAGLPLPQPLQTNQTLFNPVGPPNTLLLTTGDGCVKICSWPPPSSTQAIVNGATPNHSSHAGSHSRLSTPAPQSSSSSLQSLHTLHAHTSACISLALSPTSRYLAIGGSDALISLYDTHDWICRRTLSSLSGSVKSVSFSWDGSYVIGGSDEGTGFDIAHVETGEIVARVETTAPAPCLSWHPNGKYWIAYTGDSGGLKIVGAAGGEGSETSYYKNSSKVVQKHIQLLDGIALLFVYTPNHDIVATGLTKEKDDYVIHWAKNFAGHATKEERDYLQDLGKSFQRQNHPVEILDTVVPMCRKKINNRIKNIKRALEKPPNAASGGTNAFDINSNDPAAQRLHQYLVRKGVTDFSLDKVLNQLAADVSQDPNQLLNYTVVQLISLAYYLSLNTAEETLEPVVSCDRYLLRKIKKLGSYYQTCLVVLLELSKGTKNFRIEQVQAPATPNVSCHSDLLQSLNMWTRNFDYDEIQRTRNVMNVYGKVDFGVPGTDTIKTCQHCELTIGLRLYQRKKDLDLPGPVEVGCSKASCLYCSIYLDRFNEWEYSEELSKRTPRENSIIVRGSHNKCILGWYMPANYDNVRNRVLNSIGSMMTEIVDRLAGPPRRKSDSRSPPDRVTLDEAMKERASDLENHRRSKYGA
ncbi:MAG: hypothetical protein Q9176_002101 [Flavoplaca citrina]